MLDATLYSSRINIYILFIKDIYILSKSVELISFVFRNRKPLIIKALCLKSLFAKS